MGFVREAGVAAILLTLTLAIQSAGMAALIHWGRAQFERDLRRLNALRSALLLVRLTAVMMALHFLQILLWAGFYRWTCFPSWESALYFSTTSYSTVGYGDLILPRIWRNLGPVEGLTGVLMCGLSASFLFAITTRLIDRDKRYQQSLTSPIAERESVH